ncbi:MAG: fibronectin type III domain-containing protein, partial [Psychroserpens sp.]|nr:fibronectin type III domain-containing protein [Psychroserpens sp.]
TTYNVTSTSIDGPGSFLEAVASSNSNPGTDIIEFTAGLQVDASILTTASNPYLIQITEALTINGMGASLNGRQSWAPANAPANDLSECPGSDPSTIILSQMPNFMRVGSLGQDNSSIEVTINNLKIEQFNTIARIEENAKLTLDNFEAKDTWATLGCNLRPLIDAASGVSLTILGSEFQGFVNWGGVGTAVITSEAPANDLLIENSTFSGLQNGHSWFLSWTGQPGSEINIVSSRFFRSGALNINGDLDATNVVNSTWVNDDFFGPGYGDQFFNNSDADLNFIASTIMWPNYICDDDCDLFGAANYHMFNRVGSGMINFSETAVGFNFDSGAIATLNDTGTNGFSADIYTYIQATTVQDASALQSITNQPSLLTNTPAFNSPVFPVGTNPDIELVTPSFPGELIDVIPDTEVLINPIDGSPITTDVLGNDRFDANGFRDIGALQLSLAPILAISGSANQFVELSWQEPLHHDGEPIVRYEYQYVETGGGSPTVVDAGLSLLANVTGLTNGTEYEFSVRAVYNEGGSEVNGPYSNIVSETPLGPFGTPIVTADPGDTEVSLSWTVLDLGGRDFDSYSILWKIDGTSNYIGALATYSPDETSITVPGLTNDITYEFAVAVNASGEVSDQGFATATPSATLGIEEFSNKELSIYPVPFEDILNLRIQDENFNIKLFNIQGKLLIETENNKRINTSNLSAGIYIINIQTNNKMYT